MKVGDSIKIIDGIIDPDTGIQLDGFVGRIKEYLASNLVNIEWDSISLQNLPDIYIRSAINEGCDYLTYNIEPKDLELCVARDTPADVVKMVRKLGEKWDKLEIFGDKAELIEEIQEGVGFWDYLEEQIDFPFMATYEDEYRKYEDRDKVKVLKIDNFDDHYGLLMKCKIGRRQYIFPLCELSANDGESEQTKAAVDLYREYFWNR